MKKIIIITILGLLFVVEGKCQFFEGKIMYSIGYESNIPNVSNEQLGSLMGTEQAYVIKGNNYKSVFNGSFTKLQIYRGDENKSYMLTAKSDSLYWEDYSITNDTPISFEIKRNQDTILGTICDLIIVIAEKSKTFIYFSNEYPVNYELFANHNYGNWSYIIEKTKALPLKTIYETDQFTMTSIATQIDSLELNDNIFEIQNKDKIAKANW